MKYLFLLTLLLRCGYSSAQCISHSDVNIYKRAYKYVYADLLDDTLYSGIFSTKKYRMIVSDYLEESALDNASFLNRFIENQVFKKTRFITDITYYYSKSLHRAFGKQQRGELVLYFSPIYLNLFTVSVYPYHKFRKFRRRMLPTANSMCTLFFEEDFIQYIVYFFICSPNGQIIKAYKALVET